MADTIKYVSAVKYEFDDGASGTISDEDALEEFLEIEGRSIPQDPEYLQQKNAKTGLKALFGGLGQLDPEDAAYAAYGRSWAIKNGETQEVIDGIVDRATAGAYITAQTEWQDLPVQAKQFMIDHIDAMMKIVQGIIIFAR